MLGVVVACACCAPVAPPLRRELAHVFTLRTECHPEDGHTSGTRRRSLLLAQRTTCRATPARTLPPGGANRQRTHHTDDAVARGWLEEAGGRRTLEVRRAATHPQAPRVFILRGVRCRPNTALD